MVSGAVEKRGKEKSLIDEIIIFALRTIVNGRKTSFTICLQSLEAAGNPPPRPVGRHPKNCHCFVALFFPALI
jgi:hypothetical protein